MFLIFKNTFFLIFSISLFSTLLSAQKWTDKDAMLKSSSFDEIVQSFETDWKDKPYERGKGYKPFKRWQYKWENRLDENGAIPNAGKSLNNFNEYLSKNRSFNRTIASDWQTYGPNSTVGGYAGTGRVNSVGFDPNNSNIIYVGSAGGGLWKSTNGGDSWEAKTDFIGSIGVSAIIVDPNNTSIVYIATGDGDASDNYSIGVLKSLDGGDTWSTTGLDWSTNNNRVIRAMVMDPDDNNALIAATSDGMYRTTNSGSTWSQEQSGSFYDVKVNHLASSNTFYACTNDEVYRSTNNGDTWSLQFTESNANRLALATSANNTNYVYVLASNESGSGFLGVYRSTNSGTSFTTRSTSPNLLGWSSSGTDTGGQGWYDLAFCASPSNANTIHVGGVNNYKSTDGGSTWSITSHWSGGSGIQEVHADKHILAYQNGTTIWEGNDGGIYRSTNSGNSWTDKTSNLVISQMYKIGVSEVNNRIIAGLQDNGTKQKLTNGNWADEIGGDGMDCAISHTNGLLMYGGSQRGNLRRSTDGGDNWSGIKPTTSNGAWVTPYRIDPNNGNAIYAGYTNLYKSTNQGSNWTNIGSSLTGGNLTRLAIAPSNSNYIYAGNSDELHRSINGGASWTQVSMPGSGTTMIQVFPSDPNKLVATRSTYNNKQQVHESTDGGATWSSISSNLPSIPANCVAIHDDGQETIYLGMDVGVYWKNNTVTDWQLYNPALPNVMVSEIEIKESTNEIYLATYGRGVWKNETINTFDICVSPSGLDIASLTSNTATFDWSDFGSAPANGYEWANTTTSETPTTGTNTTNQSQSVSGLSAGIDYYFHVRSHCGTDDYSAWLTFGPYRTAVGCGTTQYDSGGANSNYGNNESFTTIICPNNGTTTATISFTAFNIESDWDALYIYDGIGIEGTIFPSSNGPTDSGFPAGGYYGSTAPPSVTSTASNGCLTLHFLSDGSVTELGWAADVTCSGSSCTSVVSNLDDSGFGSLRFALSCTEEGNEVLVDNNLLGDTIFVNSPLGLEEHALLTPPGNIPLNIKSTGNHSVIILVQSGHLELDNVHIIGGDNSFLPVIQNFGLLEFNQIEIKKGLNSTGDNINNSGTGQLTIKDQSTLKD